LGGARGSRVNQKKPDNWGRFNSDDHLHVPYFNPSNAVVCFTLHNANQSVVNSQSNGHSNGWKKSGVLGAFQNGDCENSKNACE
jgi:hypothetical protein